MKEIYNSAYRVFIWLGNEDESTGEAYTVMHSLASGFRDATGIDAGEVVGPDGFKFLPERLTKIFHPGDETNQMLRDNFRRAHHVLARLFARLWFNRIWVLQEVHSSTETETYCGSHFAPWGYLILESSWHETIGFQYFDESPYVTGSTTPAGTPYKSLTPIWKDISAAGNNRRLPIMNLVLRTRNFLATDQRDFIYGLLGHANETCDLQQLSPLMRPGYSKTTAQAYADFTRALIKIQM